MGLIPTPDHGYSKVWRIRVSRQALWLWNKIRGMPELQLGWMCQEDNSTHCCKETSEDLNFTQFLQKWAQVEIPRLGRRSKCWCCHVAPSNLWNWSYNQEPLKSGRNVVHKAASDESRLSSKNWYISMSQIGPLRNFHLTEWLLYNRSWKNSNY